MKTKVDYKCPDCGSDIWTECNMYWDSDNQSWAPTEKPNGLFSCTECDFETKYIDRVDIVPVRRTLADTMADLSADMRRASEIMDSADCLHRVSELDEYLQKIFDQIAAFEWQGKKRFTLTED